MRRLRNKNGGKMSVFDWAAFQSPQGSSYFLLKKNKAFEPRHHNHVQPARSIQKSILSFGEAAASPSKTKQITYTQNQSYCKCTPLTHTCKPHPFLTRAQSGPFSPLSAKRLAAKQGVLLMYEMKSSCCCRDESFNNTLKITVIRSR